MYIKKEGTIHKYRDRRSFVRVDALCSERVKRIYREMLVGGVGGKRGRSKDSPFRRSGRCEHAPEVTSRFESDPNVYFRRKYVLEHEHDFPDKMVVFLRQNNGVAAIPASFEELVKPSHKELVCICDACAKKMVGRLPIWCLIISEPSLARRRAGRVTLSLN